jgi:hypothetical protein
LAEMMWIALGQAVDIVTAGELGWNVAMTGA